MQKNNQKTYDLFLIVTSILAVFMVIVILLINPSKALEVANFLFSKLTHMFGSFVQLFEFICVVFIFYLAFSKIGNIKLGDGINPYSNTAWIFMFICAGLGSATMYWAFMEWAYYYLAPGLNITPKSTEALRSATSFVYLHWGITPWAVYALSSIAMCFHFYIFKNKNLKISSLIANILHINQNIVLDKIIDVVFLFSTFGGLVLTTTLSIITISAGLSGIFDINDGFYLKFILLAIVTAVFTFSSFVGLSSGMAKLAKISCILCFVFAILVFILGDSVFILNNIINSIGVFFSNYVSMSLYNDITGVSSFNSDWTVFYWLYWITYTPAVSIFVTKISKGRTIRQVIFGLIVGGCIGTWFFFGVLSSYAIDIFQSGILDVPNFISSNAGEAGVVALIKTLPFGTIFALFYFLLMMVFLASHMDATAFTISCVSTKIDSENPSKYLKVFWCIMLGLIPLAMLYINADLNTLKVAVVLSAAPFLVILAISFYGLIKWIKRMDNENYKG
ncbi:BCCT family transporter [Campylobacter sp. IFREMER_LSEM_CL292]|uniref:BCCT family transporter n=2 Tax=unclassified Campylobacter TaxID=2593542 RepID=UPI0021E90069|nr:BCCT family transporter [Campylobacter sp. IFREMER_LSEM_CL292]MCV3383073.1 BCCT family transporter [Campylobacter sp. IFREMER_LSEM_CL292]